MARVRGHAHAPVQDPRGPSVPQPEREHQRRAGVRGDRPAEVDRARGRRATDGLRAALLPSPRHARGAHPPRRYQRTGGGPEGQDIPSLRRQARRVRHEGHRPAGGCQLIPAALRGPPGDGGEAREGRGVAPRRRPRRVLRGREPR